MVGLVTKTTIQIPDFLSSGWLYGHSSSIFGSPLELTFWCLFEIFWTKFVKKFNLIYRSSGDALQHPFFSGNVLKPSLSDMVLLPSSVLQLINVTDSDQNDETDGETQGNVAFSNYQIPDIWIMEPFNSHFIVCYSNGINVTSFSSISWRKNSENYF